MKCYYCRKEACAKVGGSKGSILVALFKTDKECWTKTEKYVCREHYNKLVEVRP